MKGRELFLAALGREEAAVPPVFLRDLTLCLDESGLSTPEVCAGLYDGRKSALSVLALHRRLRQDAVVGCVHGLSMGIESIGGEVAYPSHGIPSITRHPYEDMPEELPEPSLGEQMPQVIESYRLVSEGLRGEAALVLNLEGPVTRAALLRGMEALLFDMEMQPDVAAELLCHAVRHGEVYMEGIASVALPDCAFLASATDNPDILGLGMAMEHSIPGLGSLVRRASALGMPAVFHPHGDLSHMRNRPMLEASIDSGIAGFQFAEGYDPASIRDLLEGRVCAMGGVDVSSTLLMGPEERIARESRDFLDVFRGFPGYVFMCSCSLHRGMPLENVEAMMRAVREA